MPNNPGHNPWFPQNQPFPGNQPQHPGPTTQFPTPPGPTTPAPTGPAPKSRRKGWLVIPAVALIAALGAGGVTALAIESRDGSGLNPAAAVTRVVQGDTSNPDWTATAEVAAPSVVSIEVQGAQAAGQGSGVILDREGHIATNNHVVTGAGNSAQIWVTLSDRRRYPATIVGTDVSTDLAVLQLTNPPSDLQPIAFGDVNSLEVGQPVMAIGNPLGLSKTVTTGIVSALDRPVVTQAQTQGYSPAARAQQVVTNAIQTNAAINPGNSGGALVNADGELIGINSSIATLGNSSESGSIGIGFAIPADQVQSVTQQLIKTGHAQHSYLGVSTTDAQASLDGATYVGAGIEAVAADSPAGQAGLAAGDVVVAVEDSPVGGAEALIAQIRDQQVGASVTITVIRDGKKVDFPVTLVSAP